MRKYLMPAMDMEAFDVEDVITVSAGGGEPVSDNTEPVSDNTEPSSDETSTDPSETSQTQPVPEQTGDITGEEVGTAAPIIVNMN